MQQSVFNLFKKGDDVQQVINMLRAGGMDFDFFDSQNQHQVSFRYYLYASEYTTYCSGTKADFSGKNATQLYNIIKQQKFDWNIFNLSSTK